MAIYKRASKANTYFRRKRAMVSQQIKSQNLLLQSRSDDMTATCALSLWPVQLITEMVAKLLREECEGQQLYIETGNDKQMYHKNKFFFAKYSFPFHKFCFLSWKMGLCCWILSFCFSKGLYWFCKYGWDQHIQAI